MERLDDDPGTALPGPTGGLASRVRGLAPEARAPRSKRSSTTDGIAATIALLLSATPAYSQTATPAARIELEVRVLRTSRSFDRAGLHVLQVRNGRVRLRLSDVRDWCALQTTVGAVRTGSRIDIGTASSAAAPAGDARVCGRDVVIEVGPLPTGTYDVIAALDGTQIRTEPRSVWARLVVGAR